MTGISICEIDFDEWVNLATNDPERFEELRQSKISAHIEKIQGARKERMRRLQWRIDKIREIKKDSALATCYTISEMMWETFEHLRRVLHTSEEGLRNPGRLHDTLQKIHPASPTENIIPFPDLKS